MKKKNFTKIVLMMALFIAISAFIPTSASALDISKEPCTSQTSVSVSTLDSRPDRMPTLGSIISGEITPTKVSNPDSTQIYTSELDRLLEQYEQLVKEDMKETDEVVQYVKELQNKIIELNHSVSSNI